MDHDDDWYDNLRRVIYEYLLRPFSSGCSAFELIYELPPCIVQDDGRRDTGLPSTLEDRRAESISLIWNRATPALQGDFQQKTDSGLVRKFEVGQLVLVDHGEVLKKGGI